jgi:hypothetical protein
MTANENVKTQSKLRTRLLRALKQVMEERLPLDEAADMLIFALDCDPGHDATAEIVSPCADRAEAVYTYRSVIRSALAVPDGGSAF